MYLRRNIALVVFVISLAVLSSAYALVVGANDDTDKTFEVNPDFPVVQAYNSTGTSGSRSEVEKPNVGNRVEATSFTNSSAITITDCPNPCPASGQAASLYPSPIVVSGEVGVVQRVSVTLNGFSHAFPADVDFLLVSPSGRKSVLMSDFGAGSPGVSNINIGLDDYAANPIPSTVTGNTGVPFVSGTYRPANSGTTDLFPAPAPASPYTYTLSAFNGDSPNGTWNLYIIDDANLDGGSLSGGWTITFDTRPTPPAAGEILISEFRTRGAGTTPPGSDGSADEFIEIYNNTDQSITIIDAIPGADPTSPTGAGWRFAGAQGATETTFLVLPQTLSTAGPLALPPRGYFLISTQPTTPSPAGNTYSLATYPTGTGITASGSANVSVNPASATVGFLPDDVGLAVFSTANAVSARRLDSVGYSSVTNADYFEGTGLSPASGITVAGQHSWTRKAIAPVPGNYALIPQDTGNNANDFVLVATDGATYSGVASTLGAPGPQRGPTFTANTTTAAPHHSTGGVEADEMTIIDPLQNEATAPNAVRDVAPVTNGSLGTAKFRRRFTNDSGLPIVALRYRVVDLSTRVGGSVPVGQADLRLLNSPTQSITLTDTTSVTSQALTLQTPAAQSSGGGVNSSLAEGVITTTAPLANGASTVVEFNLGVEALGAYRLRVIVEGLTVPPNGGPIRDFFDVAGMMNAGDLTVVAPAAAGVAANAGDLVISEFRLRGPSGANDEFIEIQNVSASNILVTDSGAGTGYALAASNGVARCVIPNGTVLRVGQSYLCTNSVAYSLSGYATGNATYTTDIPDNAGIALFNTSVAANFTLANRLDAVGSTSEANTLYREGAGYSPLTPFSIDYSFYRDECGKGGSITDMAPCSTNGAPKDTNNNAADFVFVDTNGTSAGAGQRLGAPGPENMASPFSVSAVSPDVVPLDSTVGNGGSSTESPAPPNVVRNFTSDPANNSTFGTLDLRFRYVNNAGVPITRLRYRIIDQTTFPAPSGFSDLRSRTSTLVVVSGINDPATCLASNGVATTPCTINVQGTTLEQPPSSPNGSAFNSTMSAGTVTLGTPLAAGASINSRFLFGIQQTGTAKVCMMAETVPETQTQPFCFGVGNGPTFTPAAAISRQQGTPPGAAVQVGTVTDPDTPIANLTVTQIAGGTATGVTVSGITVNPGTGAVSAVVSASCSATAGTVRFQVSDGVNTGTGDLQVNITANTAPTLTAPANQTVVFGQGAAYPTTSSDNGTMTYSVVSTTPAMTTPPSISPTGVVSVANSGPIGAHTIVIRATDNCGAFTDASFTVTVNQAATTTVVQTAQNAPTYGQSTTITASVAANPPGGGVPQGTVNFLDGATPIAACQNVALNGLGSAACSLNTLGAGTHTINVNYSGNTNYLASSGSAQQTVLKAALNITASSHNVTYGDAVPTITPTFSGFVLGESSANLTTQPNCSTTYTQGAGAAGSPYPTSCTGAVSANYAFNYINGSINVAKKGLTVTADNKTRAYGAANPALTATITGFIGADNAGNSTTGTAGLSTTATATSPVGNYPITATLGTLASSNYSFTTFNAGTLSITAVQLTVTANNQTRVYGAPNPTLTYSITGFVNGEGVGVVTGTPSITTTANATSAPGTYPITTAQGTLAAPNYTFTTANGTLTVTQAATTTTITNAAALGNPTSAGQSYAVNWSTTPVAPATGTPTGNVTVSDGAGATCTAAVAAGTCNLTSATSGTKTITATYAGDANFTGSTSQSVQHNVVNGLTGNVKQFIAFGTNTNLAGVTMTLLNTGTQQAVTTTTDANGNYSFSTALGQSYTITPSGLGKAFEATSRTYTNVAGNISGADFIAYDVPGPNAIPRSARVSSQIATQGQPVTVPVLITTTGVETKVSFSVEYPTGPLGVPTVTCGTGAVNCTLTVNNSLAGKVGITVTPFNSNPIPAGTRELVKITFPTQSNPATSAAIKFGDFPTAKDVRNAENNPLPMLYWTDGLVSFTGGTLLDGATISGRVTTAAGQGLRNATVTLIDTAGGRRTTITSSFGNYQFENLELGRD
ncbi:MAG: MBG domain-containing protein [Pyrinomonadaceae bacterium]